MRVLTRMDVCVCVCKCETDGRVIRARETKGSRTINQQVCRFARQRRQSSSASIRLSYNIRIEEVGRGG